MNITRNPFTGSPLGSAAFLGSSSFSVVPNNDHNTIPPQQPRAFAPAAFDPFFGAANDATALAVQQQQQEQQHQPLLETPSSPLSSADSRGASTPSTTPMRGGNDDDQDHDHDDNTDHHHLLVVESLVSKIQSVVMDEVVPTLRLRIGEEVRNALLRPLVRSHQMKSSGAAPKPAVAAADEEDDQPSVKVLSSAQPHPAAELEAADDDHRDPAIPLAELIAKARKELPEEDQEKEENHEEGKRKSRRNRKSSKATALITIDTTKKANTTATAPLSAVHPSWQPAILGGGNPTSTTNNVEAQFNAIVKKVHELPVPRSSTRNGRLYAFRLTSPSGTVANGGAVLVNVDYHMQCITFRDLGFCPGRNTTCRRLHLTNDDVHRLCCYAIATGRGYVKFCRQHIAGSCRATECHGGTCRMFHGSFEQLTQRDANLDGNLVPNREFCNQPTQCRGKCDLYHDPALMKQLCWTQQRRRR